MKTVSQSLCNAESMQLQQLKIAEDSSEKLTFQLILFRRLFIGEITTLVARIKN